MYTQNRSISAERIVKYITNIKINRFFTAFILLFVGFVCVTVNSKNSFLYSFNDCCDVNQFITAARCIRRGDVIYRDIYEVKGPILYLLYYIGTFLNENPFHGAYIIEVISFSAYIFILYKTARLYLKSDILVIAAVSSAAYYSMITKTVFAGGQCEQLLLPVFGGILYIAMEYFRKDYPEKISSGKVIMVGLLTGMIFWVKYALCGISLGLVLYIAALSIKEKKPLDILHYALLFIVGFGAVTGAVFAYFIWKGALSSLIEVYFYDMLVNYKPESETPLIYSDNLPKVFGVSVVFISAFLFPFVRSKEDIQINIYERTVLPVLIFFQGFGICLSRVWTYSPEAMHYFGVFGIIALFYEFAVAKEMVQRIIDKLTEAFFKVTDNGFSDLFVLLPVSIISVLLQYLRFGISSAARESVIHFAAFILIGCIVKILRMVQKKTGSAKKTIIVKYSLLLAAIVLLHLARSIPLCTYIRDSFKVCVFIFAFTDIVKYQKDIKNYFTQKFSKVFMHGIAFAVCLVIMGEFVSLVLTESPVALNIGLAADTYAPYNMAEIIKSSGVPDPVIINIDTLETGVYYFCDTYPPNRYMSDYNFQNGLFDFKKNYIDNKKADFIVMPHPINSEDYVCVYAKKREYIFMDTTDDGFCEVMALFARKDIAERNNWETVDLTTAVKNEYMKGGDTDA